MNRPSVLSLLALGLALSPATPAADNPFTTIDYAGASSTSARGINSNGQIVGDFTAAGQTHGFLLAGGQFTQIDFPDAKATSVNGINTQGDMVGGYADASNQTHGFLLSKGVFTPLDYPGAGFTSAQGINAAGDIAGHFQLPGKLMQGFLWSRGAWTVFDYRPGAPNNSMTCLFGINDAGDTVGHWGTNRNSRHGLSVSRGSYSHFDYGGGGFTDAKGINRAGDITGIFGDPNGRIHGFLLKSGRFTTVDVPGATQTQALGINASGQVVGLFRDAQNKTHGFVAQPAAAAPSQVLMVDDDGADCPGALRTIQDAVAQAAPGATILVCPGTYHGTVNITGAGKIGLRLIAIGRQDEVVLQGDYSERDGFHLEDVGNVLIRGFTVRDFGNKLTTAAQWGTGNNIYLKNAHYNTIEHNRLIDGDMMGIMLVDSGNNTVEYNQALIDQAKLATCGIHVEGTKSANNFFRQNLTVGNNVAGIMLSGAGAGNVVVDNTVLANGRWGITNSGTEGTWIEGNRVSYNQGPWGATPFPAAAAGAGIGIDVRDSQGLTVFDNRARNNTGTDLNWDGKGQNKFDSNACGTSSAAGGCGQ